MIYMFNKYEINMGKIYAILTITFILIFVTFTCGCSESGEQRYAKGEIDVSFKENVTKEEAREIVHSFDNCTVDWFYDDNPVTAFVNVPEGEEKMYVRLFENHTAVDFANLLWERG